MKNVLVAGGAGYIGSVMTNYLLKKNFKVFVIDNLSTGRKKNINKKVIFFKIDLSNKKKLFEKLKNYKFSIILNFVSSVNVAESKKNPKKFYKNNVLTVKNIVEFANYNKIKKFVQSSTCAVYGVSKKTKVNENTRCKPISNYAKTKLLAENHIKKNLNKNIKYAILRYFNVIGTDVSCKIGQTQYGSLFKSLANCILNNKIFIIYGKNFSTPDGHCYRDFIDVNDLVELHYLSIKRLNFYKSFILNLGYGLAISVKEVMFQFSKFGKKKIKYRYFKKRDGEIESISSDTSLLKKYFKNWKRKFSLKKSIKNVLKFERNEKSSN